VTNTASAAVKENSAALLYFSGASLDKKAFQVDELSYTELAREI
jgi:hypothetical protein